MSVAHDDDRVARILRMVEEGDDEPTPPPVQRFRSGQELFDQAPEHVPWVWHGYLASGTVTLFAGRQKAGKSTLLFCLLRAIVDGHRDFLGHPLDAQGPVVLLTEEGPETLRPKLEPITPEGRERLRVMCRNDVTPRGDFAWEAAVREAGMEALAYGARVVIIDTFTFWSMVRDENDNAAMNAAVNALGELTQQGLAVLLVHHHRKSGGDHGDAIRGGTALLGAVDLIVEMVRTGDNNNDDDEATTERELRAIGRFPEIPEAMRVRLEGDGRYVKVGEGTRAQMRSMSAEGRVRAYLRDQYPGTPTLREIEEDTGVPRSTAQRVLRELEDIGDVESFTDGRGATAAKRYRWLTDSGDEPFPKGPRNGG